jgi:hypothetical protein
MVNTDYTLDAGVDIHRSNCSVFGAVRAIVKTIWASVVCRTQPPTNLFSVSSLEKTDAQIQFLSGG